MILSVLLLKGIAIDIRMLDWQVFRFSSPAIDLIYNIFSSTDKALRDREYNNLIALYHESLCNTVKSFGSDPEKFFSLNDLKNNRTMAGD